MLQLLYDQYGEEHVRHFERDECLALNAEGKQISDVIGKEIKVIHGHFFYKEIKNIVKQDNPKLVTFMRDPVSRVISNYNWWIHTIQRDANHRQRHRINETLEEYASQPDVRNKVAQFLSGVRLKNFDFIGFLENLDDDVTKLAKVLDWRKVELKHEKDSKTFKTGKSREISPDLRKMIERLHSKDIKLYNKAKSLTFRI